MSKHSALAKFGRSGNPALNATTFTGVVPKSGEEARGMATMSLGDRPI